MTFSPLKVWTEGRAEVGLIEASRVSRATPMKELLKSCMVVK